MKNLADSIRWALGPREILDGVEIVEDPGRFGAAEIQGKIHADVIGLALIGKVGVNQALEISEQALYVKDPAEEFGKFLNLTPISISELSFSNIGTPALRIAEHLESIRAY